MDKNLKLAFTLAELLVVIGLIGVVSALTIPSLSRNTNKQENVVKLQKTYQTLQEAYSRASAKYGPITTWIKDDTDGKAKAEKIAARFSEFLKVERDCGSNEGCFPTPQVIDYREHVMSSSIDKFDYPKILISGDTSLLFYDNSTRFGTILVGLDGTKGIPIMGENFFQFDITDKGVEPFGSNSSVTYCFKVAAHCTTWVIRYGNMDYLQADTNGICKNGTQLSKTVTTCK